MGDWFLWAIGGAVIWGFVPMLEKKGITGIDHIYTAVFLRSVGVVIGMILFAIFFPEVVTRSLYGPTLPVVLLIVGGFAGSILGQICNYTALSLGEVSRVSPVIASWPVITFLLGIFLLSETVTVTKVIAMMLISTGIILLKL